jgi:hypothetical protein
MSAMQKTPPRETRKTPCMQSETHSKGVEKRTKCEKMRKRNLMERNTIGDYLEAYYSFILARTLY